MAPNPERVCAYCGVKYRPRYDREKTKFCTRDCGEAFRRENGHTRERHLLRKFGITQAEYDRLLLKQCGTCALCDVTPGTQKAKYKQFFHVDHCHDTGRVRGLLCGEHNMLLGRFNDQPALLRRAAEYLEAAAS
jgi:hypothetical protein